MEQAVESRKDEPWYADAVDALQTELQGEFADGQELMELARRMMPLYFAGYGEREQRHVASLEGDSFCVDARGSSTKEIFEHFDLRPLLPSLTMPTLVITGEQDFITGPVCAAELSEGIPGAGVRRAAGHGPHGPRRGARAVPRGRALVPARRAARLIEEVVAALREGRPAVLPTDTVYGLCATRTARPPSRGSTG